MAYFANGSEADGAWERYCSRCVNWRERIKGDLIVGPTCPVWLLHLDWNYDAAGRNADRTKRQGLDTLWPREVCYNGECQLFLANKAEQSEEPR